MHKDKDIKLGDRLRGMRVSLGSDYTQEFVARKIGVSRVSYQRYEAGFKPNKTNAEKLSLLFGCNKNWLITGMGETGLTIGVSDVSVIKPRQSNNIVDFQHNEIIKNFEDKEFAKEINEALLSIEKLSKTTFREIGAYIKGAANALKSASKDHQGEIRPAAIETREVG